MAQSPQRSRLPAKPLSHPFSLPPLLDFAAAAAAWLTALPVPAVRVRFPIWPSRTLESQSTDEGSRRHRRGPAAFCTSPPSCTAAAAVCPRTGRRGAAKTLRAAAPARLRRRGRGRGGADSPAAEPTAEKVV